MAVYNFAFIIATVGLSLSNVVRAHEHHGDGGDPNGELDALILIHIAIQFAVWCIIFPIGLIFGFSRARWHVPLQATGFLLTIGGYILGHKHKGRTFPPSLHGELANIIMFAIGLQITLGTYLKLHINEGTTFRSWMVFAHRIVGLSYPILGWSQVLFGMLVLGNICPLDPDSTRASILKCAEPFATGTLVMQYGIYSYLLSMALPRWKGQSPETWDSLILCITGVLSGVLNLWRLGSIWIGIFWTVGGIVSFILSRNGRRTVVPSVVIMITAVVEAFKATKNNDSTIYPTFASFLFLAGGARMMEVFFNAKPKQSPSSADRSTWSWIVAVCFASAGVVYMTSSPDFLRATGFTQIYAIPYLAFILGLALSIGAFVTLLSYLFYNTGRNAQLFEPRREERGGKFVVEDSDEEDAMLPHSEAFELHGTIPRASESDD
ncbi:hypothetical protein CPB86DRAFT_747230 [Serendipita vermifera]|nr:hypothetical protein CPB86DRAFT_747230 [Serendipita vermifera]